MRFSVREVFVVVGVVAVVCWSFWRVRQAEMRFEAKAANQERIHQLKVEAVRQSMGPLPAQLSASLQANLALQEELKASSYTVPPSIAWPPVKKYEAIATRWEIAPLGSRQE